MTTDIKELVKRLRAFFTETRIIEVGDVHAAADALEAMAGEVERLNAECCRCGQPTTALCKAAQAAEAERDRLKAALDIAKAHAKQNQRARDLVSPYPNDHAKRIVWEKALYHEGKDLWDKLRKALGGDAS